MESSVILFEEIQRSRSVVNRWFFGIVAIIFGIMLIWNRFSGKEMPLYSGLLWVGFAIFILLQLFVSSSFRLITQIREDGIWVRFPPYQPSFVRFAWEDIREVYIRNFDPLREYGYGIRLGPNGRGYVLPGDTGIQLVLNDNSRVIISTKRPQEIMEILKKIGRAG